MAGTRRITMELAECTSKPPAGMTVSAATEADIRRWHVTLDGPAGTPYAGGVFGLVVALPDQYPFKPPNVSFTTRIYHPNVTNDSTGAICLGVLKSENWKPASRLMGVLEAVRGLLVEPQPDDPLENRIADEYKSDRPEFDKNVRAYVARYAKGPARFDRVDAAPAKEAGPAKSASAS